jgi:hypothetical protein
MAYSYLGQRYVVQASWEDAAAHLTQEAREELWSSIPEYQRDARSKGIPQLGAGAIFAIPESEIVVEPLKGGIPAHWPRGFGMDPHWSFTSVTWWAQDPESLTCYMYDEYQREKQPVGVHAASIKARGDWIVGVIDKAADQTEGDGEKLLEMYLRAGLHVVKSSASKGVDAGLQDMLDAMHEGRFKVFSTCQKWIKEFRIYRRNDKGVIVKKADHLLDSSRYFWNDGRALMRVKPKQANFRPSAPIASPRAWMA